MKSRGQQDVKVFEQLPDTAYVMLYDPTKPAGQRYGCIPVTAFRGYVESLPGPPGPEGPRVLRVMWVLPENPDQWANPDLWVPRGLPAPKARPGMPALKAYPVTRV